jgi:hypothetical protein
VKGGPVPAQAKPKQNLSASDVMVAPEEAPQPAAADTAQ